MNKNVLTEYGSDIVVKLLQDLNFEYIAFNPGATFRGLHESLLNYGGNQHPEIILCCHEEISVAIAHGYFKAAGRPMAVATHNIVGLQHASMAIFNAWCDRVPVYVLGGTGPMDTTQRRPWIDWVHTALVQGNLVRDYVKWDDQPYSLAALPESFLRGYRTMMTLPYGPVYICLDAGLQESVLSETMELPEANRFLPPSIGEINSELLLKIASWLVEAKYPVIIADYLGREQEAMTSLVELADILVAPVIDQGNSISFPNCNPLDATEAEADVLSKADLILALETPSLSRSLTPTNRSNRQRENMNNSAKVIHIGLHDLITSSWAGDSQKLLPQDISVIASAGQAVKALSQLCRSLLKKPEEIRELRRKELAAKHCQRRKNWLSQAEKDGGKKPISSKWLTLKLWEVIKEKDWVLVNKGLTNWPRRLWQLEKPDQYLGDSGGAGVGYGIGASIGAALAYKGSGRLCVDIQGDGDFLYTPSALWTAAHYKIPLLIIMNNNRTYNNSENHTHLVASSRNRSIASIDIGNRLEDPNVDYATIARSFGIFAEGPVSDPGLLEDILVRAVNYVLTENKPALVDVVTTSG